MLVESEQKGFPPASDFRLFLQSELIRRCRLNPKYSLRAYAKSLDIDSSTLSKILRGKRPLGGISIKRLGDKLNLSPPEISHFIHVAKNLKKKRSHERHEPEIDDYEQLAKDSFEVISDWYHYAILELIKVRGFQANPRWIAKALGISVSEVNIAVERLARIGILERDGEEHWREKTNGKTTTFPEKTSAAIRRTQKQVLQQAIASIDQVAIDKRDHSSMTVAIDPNRIGAAKEKIKKFRRDLAEFLTSSPDRTQVYQLSLALFPITDFGTEN